MRMRSLRDIDNARRNRDAGCRPRPDWCGSRRDPCDRCGPLWIIRSRDGPRDGGAAALCAGATERSAMSARPSPSLICRGTGAGASTRRNALDVDYGMLPAVTDAPRRRDPRPGAARCCMPRRPAMFASAGRVAMKPRCAPALQSAAHVTRIDLVNNRLIGAAIEPRAVIAFRRSGEGARLTLYSSTQVPHHIRRLVGEELGLAEKPHPRGCARCRRRLRLQGQALSGRRTVLAYAARRLKPTSQMGGEPFGKLRLRLSGSRSRDAGRAGARSGRTFSLRSKWRRSPISAVTSRASAPRSPSAIYSAPALPASIATPAVFRRNRPAVLTNTVPTDALSWRPAGPKPVTCWSGSPTRRRASSASTAPRSAGAISSAKSRCRTGRRSARPMTRATFRKC